MDLFKECMQNLDEKLSLQKIMKEQKLKRRFSEAPEKNLKMLKEEEGNYPENKRRRFASLTNISPTFPRSNKKPPQKDLFKEYCNTTVKQVSVQNLEEEKLEKHVTAEETLQMDLEELEKKEKRNELRKREQERRRIEASQGPGNNFLQGVFLEAFEDSVGIYGLKKHCIF